MALTQFPLPATYQNKKQLKAIARYRNKNYTAETTQAGLVTLANS